MMPLRYQILISLLLGFALGYSLDLALNVTAEPIPAAPTELEQKSEAFTTQAGMLAVTFVVRREAAPEIMGVQSLPEGRVTVTTPGENALELHDARGQVLYQLPFRATFLQAGEPPTLVDEVTLIFVVPDSAEVVEVVATTPHGTATHILER